MNAALTAAQVNFDALGMPHKSHLVQIAAEEGENYIQEIIKKAAILFRNSHAEKLTPRHINTILESMNEPQLLGYNNSPSFLLSSVGYENSEVFVVKDPIEQLDNSMTKPSPPKPRYYPYGFQWFLAEGVPAQYSGRSGANGSPGNGHVLRPSSVDTSSRSYSTRQFVGDVLNTKYQADYVKTINMLRDDTSNQKLQALKFLRTDKGIQPLLPYFLQFVIGEIAVHYNNPVLIDIVVSVVLALAENQYLCISLFTHCFVRIVMTILITPDSSSRISEEDCRIRDKAAKILKILCDRCEDAYPEFKVSVFNRLVETLFNPESTLAAHYGALVGIEVLGYGALLSVIPHLLVYCKFISKNQTSRQQTAYVLLIKDVIYRMIRTVQQKEDLPENVASAIEKIKAVDI